MRPSAQHYPRRIKHVETVEYRYDPETKAYSAEVLQAEEPIVTAWDDTPPPADPRTVGIWDVSPREDGIDVVEQDKAQQQIPHEQLRKQLQEQAERTGQPVSLVRRLEYEHDLDTRDTSHSVKQRRTPEQLVHDLQARQNRAGAGSDGVLDRRSLKLLEKLAAAQQQKKANRRKAKTPVRERDGRVKLPEIVITSEAVSPNAGFRERSGI